MEQPYLPKGVLPADIYRSLSWMPDCYKQNRALAVSDLCNKKGHNLSYDDAAEWFDFWVFEKARLAALSIQADKEWALKQLIMPKRRPYRGYHGP